MEATVAIDVAKAADSPALILVFTVTGFWGTMILEPGSTEG